MADLDQSAAAVKDQAIAEVGGEEAFHSYTGDDGKVQSWKTPDELNDFIKKSGMFQKDYTQKSQKREDEYRKRMQEVEKREAEYKKQREDWEKNEKAKYDRYNQVLSTRPSIQKILANAVNKPTSPDEIFERSQSYANEKATALEQRIAKIEQMNQEAMLEKERDAKFAELEQEIPGFDRNVVTQALQELDAGDMKSLIAMVYKSSKYNPVELQQEVEEKIAAKAGAKMTPGGGGPPKKSKGSSDPKEAKEEAYRDMGI